MRAVLSIGSNVGDREGFLRSVYEEFRGHIVAASPVYATPPWGVTDQDEFLNAVLIVDVPPFPWQLLRRCQRLEQAAQRTRLRHWGPRTLDVDIVDIVGFTSTDAALTVPHPYAHQRAFVLVPWLAADEHAVLNGVALAEWIAALDPAEVAQVRKVGGIDKHESGSV